MSLIHHQKPLQLLYNVEPEYDSIVAPSRWVNTVWIDTL